MGAPEVMSELYHGVECDCQKSARIHRMFKSSHITEAFQQLGFKNFTTDGRPQAVVNAKAAALDYLKRFKAIRADRNNSLALLGIPGGGKTHLLMAISNNLIRKGVGVLYFPWVEGGNDLKDDMDKLEEKVGHMKRVDVLYIDDLFKGRRKPTDFMLEQMFGVINYRYLNCLPILVSSERDIDEICDIDMGLGSRIFEMAKRYTVILKLTDEEAKQGAEINYRLK